MGLEVVAGQSQYGSGTIQEAIESNIVLQQAQRLQYDLSMGPNILPSLVGILHLSRWAECNVHL
jgi:hypothetical protein